MTAKITNLYFTVLNRLTLDQVRWIEILYHKIFKTINEYTVKRQQMSRHSSKRRL